LCGTCEAIEQTLNNATVLHADAIALAGYDFLVLPPPVIEKMKSTLTISVRRK